MATFLIGGIWHGAGWTFVFWGFLHGFSIVLHRIWNQLGFRMNTILAWFITFNFLNITWIFFRAKEWDDAIKVLNGMFGMSGLRLPGFLQSKLSFLTQYGVEFTAWLRNVESELNPIPWILFGFVLILAFKNSNEQLNKFKTNSRYLVFTILLLLIALSLMDQVSEFLYFNF